MSDLKNSPTTTICELYTALRVLEEAFGYFADVLAGLRCLDPDCEGPVPIDPPSRDVLDWFEDNRAPKPNDGGGRPPCETNPCLVDPDTVANTIQEFGSRVPGMADAAVRVLKNYSGTDIKFMTRPWPRSRA